MAGYVFDLAECSVKSWLLLFLCKDNIVLKEKYRSTGKVLFFLQSFLIGYWLSHSAWIDRVLYADASGQMNNSGYSIAKLVVAFCSSYIAMEILYQGRRQAKAYLLLVFYTVQEMTRFTVHSIWSLATKAYIDYLNAKIMAGTIGVEQFLARTGGLQFFGLLAFAAGYLAFMHVVFVMYRRHMTEPVEELSRQGLWFLMLTPVIAMVFDVSWRISFYSRKGAEIEFLYEKHGSMYVVVPTIAILCLVCTVFSRKIYSELMLSEEQKNNLLFYKQQLADMTAHVKELEQLYEGIRGMRHDINNYVADMEQLLQTGEQNGQMPKQVRQEADGYLRSMQRTADQLSLRFYTGNPVTDVILNRKGQICEQERIVMEGELPFPAQLGIEAFDLGILLNNALDNAIEACRKMPVDSGKVISFRGYAKGRMYFLVVQNTYASSLLRTGEGGLRTTKADRNAHGLGMSNMRSCVEKYYGTMQYDAKDGKFVLTLMLQGRSL